MVRPATVIAPLRISTRSAAKPVTRLSRLRSTSDLRSRSPDQLNSAIGVRQLGQIKQPVGSRMPATDHKNSFTSVCCTVGSQYIWDAVSDATACRSLANRLQTGCAERILILPRSGCVNDRGSTVDSDRTILDNQRERRVLAPARCYLVDALARNRPHRRAGFDNGPHFGRIG
jgi:hypothetical protein